MPKFDTLGNLCKFYEQNFGNSTYLMPKVPGLCRIDGRCFHSFTKGLMRPYDPRLSGLMIDTLRFLMEETGAVWGYTQSDEISLCWYTDKSESQIFFDGRRQKIESITAALASSFFNRELGKGERIPEKRDSLAIFDSRCWSVPTKSEAIKYALWREIDSTKNSITMAASEYFSHTELHGVTGKVKQEMLWSKHGVNWNTYPAFFKRGTFIRKEYTERAYSAEEIEKLPAKHEARTNPNLTTSRSDYRIVDMPPFKSVKNKIGVLFNGETPQTS